MKRRWLAVLLTAAMTAGALSGCGGGSSAGTADTTGTEAPAESQENSGGVIRRKLRQTARRQQMQRM